MNLEIDDDLLDDLVAASLQQSIKLIEAEIKRLKKIKNRQSAQDEDLAFSLVNLDGLKVAYAYYGGNIK